MKVVTTSVGLSAGSRIKSKEMSGLIAALPAHSLAPGRLSGSEMGIAATATTQTWDTFVRVAPAPCAAPADEGHLSHPCEETEVHRSEERNQEAHRPLG